MPKNVIGISNCEIVDHGAAVLFAVDMEDSEFIQMKIGIEAIPKVAQTLLHHRSIAEKMTVVRAAQPHELASPWRATGVRVGRFPFDQAIALRVDTDQNIPITLALSESLALQAIGQLQLIVDGDRNPPGGKLS